MRFAIVTSVGRGTLSDRMTCGTIADGDAEMIAWFAETFSLIAKGKKPKVALTACMRKLIIILNTMIARRQKWDPRLYVLN